YPTLLDLAGYAEQEPDILQGKSIVPWLENSDYQLEEKYDAYTVSYGGTAASLKSGMWRYTRWGEGIEGDNEELYNHSDDPEEHHNLANDPAVRSMLEAMRNRLEVIRQKAQNHL
ncbi:MAG: sulfatase/phosphatase domain-containing protein, partial [Pseudomonadota bacterium]